jgi:hypothetical protein
MADSGISNDISRNFVIAEIKLSDRIHSESLIRTWTLLQPTFETEQLKTNSEHKDVSSNKSMETVRSLFSMQFSRGSFVMPGNDQRTEEYQQLRELTKLTQWPQYPFLRLNWLSSLGLRRLLSYQCSLTYAGSIYIFPTGIAAFMHGFVTRLYVI